MFFQGLFKKEILYLFKALAKVCHKSSQCHLLREDLLLSLGCACFKAFFKGFLLFVQCLFKGCLKGQGLHKGLHCLSPKGWVKGLFKGFYKAWLRAV